MAETAVYTLGSCGLSIAAAIGALAAVDARQIVVRIAGAVVALAAAPPAVLCLFRALHG